MRISVCVCTFKRAHLLPTLLAALEAQQGEFSHSVIVVDNDNAQSARETVEEFARRSRVPVKYTVEPEQNIALARNRAVAESSGDFIAFIDDDELPSDCWLQNLLKCCVEFNVAGMLGPVLPRFEQEPPAWVIRGKFCDRPRFKTGYELSWRETRTGNVLFRRSLLQQIEEPFRRLLGNGGEDQDFFRRMMERGHRFLWCDEATVSEIVPAERCKRSYMLKRALLRGQCERHLADLPGVVKSLIAVPVYSLALPLLLITGQHLFMRYAVKLLDHFGKLIGLMGFKPLGDKYMAVQTSSSSKKACS